MLRVKNIKAGYDNVPVLFDVSFEIHEGEVVSIVGSNGAGKSTILRVISGLI
jgi:branched-chain amino acid transport system ATP-binding protein